MIDQIERISFPCIEVKQPIGTFYCGVIDAWDVVAVSKADVRRIVDRNIEVLSGIQRPLSQSRVEELQAYVRTVDASFPTAVILAVKSEHADFDSVSGKMSLVREADVATIIDGQHRIAGLKEVSKGTFYLNVVLFVEMELEDQAMLFATINLTQTKVNKSLAYDLYDFTKARSPQKTCHNIARLLNRETDSPLSGMIKILGVASGKPSETITQATFVERLMPFISMEPLKDKDALKRGRKLKEATTDEATKGLIFRNLFIRSDDATIAKTVWNYFDAVKEKWPVSWSTIERGNMLNRASGFAALMRFLRECYKKLGKRDELATREEFGGIFRRIGLSDRGFTTERYKPGTSGETELYRALIKDAGM